MSARVRRRVEDEAAQEEAWSIDNYDWDPQACTARKKRMLAPGLAGAPSGLPSAFDVGQDLLTAAVGAAAAGQTMLPLGAHQLGGQPELDMTDPAFAGLPVLEPGDRADAEPATVCEVVGCGASLEGLKRYYVRMRVCEKHLNAPAIVVNGVISRFCQQCARFQFVGEFAGSKKSCIATLERHNARHRAKVLARQQEAAEEGSRRGAKGGKAAKAGGGKRRGAVGAGPELAAPAPDGMPPRPLTSSDLSAGGGAGVAGGGGVDDVSGAFLGGAGGTAAELAYMRQKQLAAEAAAAPSKPASPNYYAYGWDGNGNAPNANVDNAIAAAPPQSLRPLVTTGGNGLVVAGERTASGPLGAAASAGLSAPTLAGLQPQPAEMRAGPPQQLHPHPGSMGPQPQPQPWADGWGGRGHGPELSHPHMHAHAPFEQRYGAMLQQQQHLMGHMRSSSQQQPMPAPPPPLDVQRAMAAVPPQLLQPAGASPTTGTAAAAPFAVQKDASGSAPNLPGAGSGGGSFHGGVQKPAHHMHRDDSFSNGSTPVGSNAVGGPPGAASDSSGTHSQATARQALTAVGVGRAASVGAAHSDVSRSAASGGNGGAVMAAGSPGTISSADQAPVGRGSATGSGGFPAGGAASGDGGGQVSNVAARINSIMEELCPLIAQYKQQASHGSGGGVAPPPGMRGDVGASGSGSLPPVVDAAVVMMREASQLAASLPQAQSWPNEAAAAAPPPQAAYAVHGQGVGSYGRPMPQVQIQVPPPPQQHQNGPVWRSLSSHPGIVINGAVLAPSYAIAPGQGAVAAPPAPPHAGGGVYMALPVPGHVMGGPPGTYFAPSGSGAMNAMAVYGGALVYEQQQQLKQDQSGAPLRTAMPPPPAMPPPVTLAGGGGDEPDDELLGQLLAFLEEPSDSEQVARQQQQQQQYRSMAAAAQQAVGQHQAAMQALPYGAPLRPLTWQPAPVPPPMYDGPIPVEGGGMHAPYPQQPGQPGMPPHGMSAGVGGIPESAGDDVDPRELTRVSLKAMNVLPHELPPNLRANLRRWLKEARAEALQATLRPGCLQLVVDVLRPADGSGGALASEAELASTLLMPDDPDQAAADVFRILGQRLRDTYVQVDRQVLQIRVGERPVVLSWEEAAEDGGLDGAKYPAIKGCSAAAVCAGSDVTLQLTGGNLSHPRTRAFARLRGHDLPASLLPPSPSPATAGIAPEGGSARIGVAVPAGTVGLMVVEVGVGHLLGDWWPLLVLPRGQEGAAEELAALQSQAQTSPEAAHGFRRLLSELASVLETLADAKAAAASAAAAAAEAEAAAASDAAAVTSSDNSPTAALAATTVATASRSPADGTARNNAGGSGSGNGRSSSPGSGSSRSDGSTTPASAAGWCYSGGADSLVSTAAGSTLNSLATRSTGHPAAGPNGGAHGLGRISGGHAAAGAPGLALAPKPTAGGSPGNRTACVVPVVAPPPAATLRRALVRAARLLRYAVARGLPHLSALLLAAATGLRASPAGADSKDAAKAAEGASAALASLGVDPQSLLPLAVLSGSGRLVDVLAAFAASVVGQPLRLDAPQGPAGMSPLHLAALLPDGGALARHLLASQPWAAWAWLALGWQPDMEAAPAPAAEKPNGRASTAADEDAKETDEEQEEEEVTLPRRAPRRLTPGSLSTLLGGKETVRWAAKVLATEARASVEASAGAADAAATAALMGAMEAWGRTGAALLSALCDQLARQRL